MTEHQRETAFLKYVIAFDDTAERRELEGRIAHVQRDARCVRRAASLLALVSALFAAALVYAVILQEDYPYNGSQFIIKLLCELGVASLISLVVLMGVSLTYRGKLNRLREECRRLVTRLLEVRLSKPHLTRGLDPQAAVGQGEVSRVAVEGNGRFTAWTRGWKYVRGENKTSLRTNSSP
jgi:hypothetical protein